MDNADLNACCLIAAAVLAGSQLVAQPGPTFEVASVKPNTSGTRNVMIEPITGGRFRAANVTLGILVGTAYDVEDFQISGGPKWLNTESYDIEAKAEGNPDLAQIRLLLQSLLAERFQLAIHREQKELAVYVLSVAKGGPRLSPPDNPACQPPPAGRCGGTSLAGGTMLGQNLARAQVARVLSKLLLRPVLDRTNIPGVFNIQLKFSPESRVGEVPRASEGAAGQNLPSIFSALEEQAGLKPDSRKEPVELLVIDRAERPSPN